MKDNKTIKKLSGMEALAIVVGMVIGSGIFFKPTAIFTATGAPGLGMAAWVIGAIMSICGGLTVAELGAAIPKTGGVIIFLKEIYGDIYGFLFGWAQTVIYFPGILAALAIIFGTQTVALLGINKAFGPFIGLSVILFLTVVNILGGSKVSAKLQTVATIAKLIPLVLIIVVGMVKGAGNTANLLPMTDANHPVSTGLGSALLAVLFAYNGWINVGNMAGEIENPGKNLPLAIIGGLSVVMFIFTAINIAYLLVLPASVLAKTPTPAADVAKVIFGPSGGSFITIGILVSIFGAMNAFLLTTPRVPYALALENKLPFSNLLAKSDKNGTPIGTTLLLVILTSLYIITGQFDQLTNLAMFVLWFFFVLTFAGCMVLRKKQPNLHRPFKVPLYPITPIVAILGGAYVLVNAVITQRTNSLLGIGITLLGIPLYLARRSKFTTTTTVTETSADDVETKKVG